MLLAEMKEEERPCRAQAAQFKTVPYSACQSKVLIFMYKGSRGKQAQQGKVAGIQIKKKKKKLRSDTFKLVEKLAGKPSNTNNK